MNSVSHLLVEPLEDVLLCDDLKPVAVHFLSQVSVLALLQLDESRHLRPEGVLAQSRQTLAETHQELLDLLLHQLRAAGSHTGSKRRRRVRDRNTNGPTHGRVHSPELGGLCFHGDGEAQHPGGVPAGGVHLVPEDHEVIKQML